MSDWLLFWFAALSAAVLYFHGIESSQNYLKMIRRQAHPKWKNKIVCQVCKHACKQLNKRARAMREYYKELGTAHTLGEEKYLNLTNEMCNPYHSDGEWITQFDLVKKAPKLVMQPMNAFGRCGRECETIALTCAYILDGVGLLEKMAEYAFKQFSTSKMERKVCRTICKQEQSDISAATEIGSEPFQPIGEQQRQMFKSFVLSEQEKARNSNVDQEYLEEWVENYATQEHYDKKFKASKIKRIRKLCKKGVKSGHDCVEAEAEEEEEEEEREHDELERKQLGADADADAEAEAAAEAAADAENGVEDDGKYEL